MKSNPLTIRRGRGYFALYNKKGSFIGKLPLGSLREDVEVIKLLNNKNNKILFDEISRILVK